VLHNWDERNQRRSCDFFIKRWDLGAKNNLVLESYRKLSNELCSVCKYRLHMISHGNCSSHSYEKRST